MKIIKVLVSIAVFSGLALFGLKFYTQGASGELPAVIDQLNPLVTKGEVYVKTKQPDEVNSYGTAKYIQKAVDANGNEREIEFNGISVLKEDRYLKLTNKGAHVETYEEVSREAVPEKALSVIG
ncbi:MULTISPECIES: YxeA family protein [unclassified Enterococcus]|uniref:YxeA family protein n=1 Tax=unclassified Enterococcus TaxID=2608891 RepID=UPI001A928B02|nr:MULTISPECIES: YxeA family protein [unclassified Enterococcus]MBO0462844.1 YxeA family protein [Enterococcus sp. DIV1298c]MBO1300917.1 YxeA family protein [Enterococcus sp. DIV1271a]